MRFPFMGLFSKYKCKTHLNYFGILSCTDEISSTPGFSFTSDGELTPLVVSGAQILVGFS
jgi:hypothetical protein